MLAPHEIRAIEIEATRQTYWQAARETCARLRHHRRMGWDMPWAIESHYRLLRYYLSRWRAARDEQLQQHSMGRAA
ncbi:MAG TPA: hypothetical protein VK090_06605 [Paracoccaceae bacterium]|nr:hypothetical protein [Paracoccaceae bacterium]